MKERKNVIVSVTTFAAKTQGKENERGYARCLGEFNFSIHK